MTPPEMRTDYLGGASEKVINLDDRRPHITIDLHCIDKDEIHIIPMSLINDWISGKEKLSNANESVLRVIIRDWLAML